MNIEIPIRFVNEEQEIFFNLTKRNQCFSGGYGNGKTHILCLKPLFLLTNFPKYRVAFVRRIFKDLRRTTMATFYQLCPEKLYNEKQGGRRNDNDGYCRLINGSEIFFIGLDNFSEQSLKSFEINTACVDQAEELDENIYITLDSRIGRWSHAEIPPHLSHLNFPVNAFTGKPTPPAYNLLACNPDTTFHWIYRIYHPNSIDFHKYSASHEMINCPSTKNPALNPETLKAMMSRDPEWVKRYVFGEWGISDAVIHTILPDSIIDPESDWLSNFIRKARLYRVMDHGEASPTCVLWFAVFNNIYLCYREYYEPNKLISEHRQNIQDLSGDEKYVGNFADPSIFNKTSQKKGGRWSVSDEYLDSSICGAKTIGWQPADNNEFANRNRINELLRLHTDIVNPLSGETNSPLLFFVKKSANNPQGCYHVIRETGAARRKLLGYDNGRSIYCDDREESITDHSYDCLRYFASIKALYRESISPTIPEGSFFDVVREIKKLKYLGRYNYGLPRFAA